MLDGYGRKIDYLRISVTDRCNLRCMYCMPEKGIDLIPHEEILSFEEIFRVVKSASQLGINKIRITGGEPLVRVGLPKLIKSIKSLPGIREVSMTTNGALLEKHMDELDKAGLDRVNISLDTLNKEKYLRVTRLGDLDKVLRGIKLAIEKGLTPVKLNVVVTKEINFSEIMDFVKLGEELPLDIRFIELMPIGEGRKFTHVSNEEIKTAIRKHRELIPCSEVKGSGPAKYFKTPFSQGSIGFISPMSHEFCGTCNRVRLTSEGFLKLCLHWKTGINLKEFLRSGVKDKELTEIISEAIKGKPDKHGFISRKVSDGRIMSQIGG
ncbi:MAG: 3,8-cyclase [Clostridia bacterium]|nr:3,8-cyclase [Clostridia bacterium]